MHDQGHDQARAMISRRRAVAAAAAALTASACAPAGLVFHDEPIDGPYRLRAPTSAAEMHICYDRRNGPCELRIPGRVFAIADDQHFIAAAVRPLNVETKKVFYYIVREFDAPGATPDELQRIVRGPYEHDAFVDEMRDHGVPAPKLIAPRR